MWVGLSLRLRASKRVSAVWLLAVAICCGLSGCQGVSPGVAVPTVVDTTNRNSVTSRQIADELGASADPYDVLLGASILVESGELSAYRTIVDLASSTDVLVQRAAVDTLASIRNANSMHILQQLAGNEAHLYALVLRALVSNPREDSVDFLVTSLAKDDNIDRTAAISALAMQGNLKQRKLLHGIAGNQRERQLIRAYAYYGLARQDPNAVAIADLIALVDAQDVMTTEVVVVTLGYLQGFAVEQEIERFSKSADPRVAIAARVSGAAVGDAVASETLANHACTNSSSIVASVVAGGLKRLPSQKAIDVTRLLMKCPTLTTDAAARTVESWAWIDSEHFQEVAQWGLAHPKLEVQLQTLWAIGLRDGDCEIVGLRKFLHHSDLLVRGMAAWAYVRSCQQKAGQTTGYRT